MKLRAWLDEREISNGDFGGRINRTAEAVRRYAAGERLPDRATMPLIVRETGGEVQPNDFFDIEVNAEAASHCANCGARAAAEVIACTNVDCPARAAREVAEAA